MWLIWLKSPCDLSKTDFPSDLLSSSPSAGDSKGIEDMDMNAVRLCFQCELEWDDGRKDSLSPVVSNPIYDKSETSPNTLHGFSVNGVNNFYQKQSVSPIFS